MTGYFFLGLMVALTTAGQLLSKKGSEKVTMNGPVLAGARSLFNGYLILAALITGAAPIFYILALREIDLSTAFAFTGLNYVFVSLGGKLVFGETLNLYHYLGMLSISSGILVFYK